MKPPNNIEKILLAHYYRRTKNIDIQKCSELIYEEIKKSKILMLKRICRSMTHCKKLWDDCRPCQIKKELTKLGVK